MHLENAAMMDRRLLLQSALVLIGSTVALGACATLPKASDATDLFSFSEPQRATLSALADTIMPATSTPGALAAGVPAQVEAMMHGWASAATRAEMVAALGRIEALGGGFSSLSAAQRHDLLNPYDAEALTVARDAGSSMAERMAGPQRRDQGYAVLRELVLILYYYSEIGLTQELEYAALPGRWDPSVPLTPTSRARGGFGNY